MADDMPGLPLAAADEVFGIAELGAHILGFIDNLTDLRRAALVDKRFHRAAQFHLWWAVRLPYLGSSPDPTDNVPFWDRFSALLEHHTLSLTLDMSVADPANFQRIMGRRWEARFRVPESFSTKADLDNMFCGLMWTLVKAKRLRGFTARDVPRILDLLSALQIYHPDLQSISIAASSRDTFGLRPLPAIDIHHWNQELRNNPTMTVPLANSVNFSPRAIWNPFSMLGFPNLRVLSLTNLQYDCQHPSPLFDALVVILKGAPNLADLELSARHKIGGITLSGYFLENMYGQPTRHRHALQSLCLQFAQAGGRPLHLQTLRLGYGFEIYDECVSNFLPPPPRPHYISLLTDLQCLTELHVESPNQKDGSRLSRLGDDKGLELALSSRFMHIRGMPNVRKITFPWSNSWLLRQLHRVNSPRLAQVILRIDAPSPTDWTDSSLPNSCPIWVKRTSVNPKSWNTLKLGGLILPTEHMCPEAADRFLSFVPYLKPMYALKIRMPNLTGGNNSRSHMRTFRKRMERMTELRELWLADGLGNWVGPEPDSPRVQDPYPTEVQFRRFSKTIAEKCLKLEYLRILDRAWTITRSGEEGAEPVLKALEPWKVESEMPWAFDWSKPKAF